MPPKKLSSKSRPSGSTPTPPPVLPVQGAPSPLESDTVLTADYPSDRPTSNAKALEGDRYRLSKTVHPLEWEAAAGLTGAELDGAAFDIQALNAEALDAEASYRGDLDTGDLDTGDLDAEASHPEGLDTEDLDTEDLDGEPCDADGLDLVALGQASGYSKTIGDDAVGAFFKEMARYPLLRGDEEIELARRVRYLMEVEALRDRLTQELGHPPSPAELAAALGLSERQLDHRLYLSRVAKRTMIRSNLRLVVSIAKRYLNRGVPFLDLIQEGALGLNRAAEKFDPDKGYKFSTYAYWWIRQGITRTIANDSRTIRLPIHVVEKLNRLKKAHRDLRKQFNRNPTEVELAQALEISLEQLHGLQQAKHQSLSLNHRVGKGEDTELMDLLEDGDTQRPEAQISETMLRQEIWDVLDNVLTQREKDVIALRYGLASSRHYTLEEVGGLFNLSRERVRQIQNKAMRKLRRPQVAERLKGWLG
jgi:RNA polymerase sigma factor (RpoD-like family)